MKTMLTALLVLSLLSGGLIAMANTPETMSYVLQPGIQLDVNATGQVTKVTALNTVAESVLGDLQLLNMSIENAVALAVQHMQHLGFTYGVDDILVTGDENMIRRAEQLYRKLEELHKKNSNPKPTTPAENDENDEEIDEIENQEGKNEEARGYIMVQAAKEFAEMNPGKYNILVNKMGKNPANYVNVSMKDVMKEYVAGK